MCPYKRTDLLLKQKRSYLTGMVEMSNNQYVLYDDMNDEVHLLEEIQDYYLEIQSSNGWRAGKWLGYGKVKTELETVALHCGDTVRIRKRLPVALDEMLKELQDETFVHFIKQLNSLSFSPYDCIYSYNQLLFMENRVNKKGVSFFQFDNEEGICAVQHHFERGIHSFDRIEFTTSSGDRSILSAIY